MRLLDELATHTSDPALAAGLLRAGAAPDGLAGLREVTDELLADPAWAALVVDGTADPDVLALVCRAQPTTAGPAAAAAAGCPTDARVAVLAALADAGRLATDGQPIIDAMTGGSREDDARSAGDACGRAISDGQVDDAAWVLGRLAGTSQHSSTGVASYLTRLVDQHGRAFARRVVAEAPPLRARTHVEAALADPRLSWMVDDDVLRRALGPVPLHRLVDARRAGHDPDQLARLVDGVELDWFVMRDLLEADDPLLGTLVAHGRLPDQPDVLVVAAAVRLLLRDGADAAADPSLVRDVANHAAESRSVLGDVTLRDSVLHRVAVDHLSIVGAAYLLVAFPDGAADLLRETAATQPSRAREIAARITTVGRNHEPDGALVAIVTELVDAKLGDRAARLAWASVGRTGPTGTAVAARIADAQIGGAPLSATTATLLRDAVCRRLTAHLALDELLVAAALHDGGFDGTVDELIETALALRA